MLVAVNSLASGKEVVVSRGELVEIGGAFRIPDILAKSGAVLREVAPPTARIRPTTNERLARTRACCSRCTPATTASSDFPADVPLRELVDIGKTHGLPVMEDLGSGALVDLSQFGLPKEPVVAEQIALGADVVTFSGDKILGGPQAGLIVGKRAWLQQIDRESVASGGALRQADHRGARGDVEVVSAVGRCARRDSDAADVGAAARRNGEARRRRRCRGCSVTLGEDFHVALEDSTSQVGSGALPTDELPTKVIAVESRVLSAERLAARFRAARPPIIGRIRDGRFLLDLRTIFDGDDLIPRWSAADTLS